MKNPEKLIIHGQNFLRISFREISFNIKLDIESMLIINVLGGSMALIFGTGLYLINLKVYLVGLLFESSNRAIY